MITDRKKTGSAAGALIGRRAAALTEAYLAGLGYEFLDNAPLLRTKGLEAPGPGGGRPRAGAPFTKNSLAKEFRIVRELVSGEAEKRQLRDFCRSGAVEAITGGATPADLAHGMGNTLGASNTLFETYVPVQLATLQNVAGREAKRAGEDQGGGMTRDDPDRRRRSTARAARHDRAG